MREIKIEKKKESEKKIVIKKSTNCEGRMFVNEFKLSHAV